MPVPAFDIPTFVNLYLPPDKRLPRFLASFTSFLSGIEWRNNVFYAWINGDPQVFYSSAVTYAANACVQYNFSTYESIAGGNTGNQPDISPAWWTLRCTSFIGAYERAKYSGAYLKLTYQLNRYFQTTFRQPPYPPPYDFGTGSGAWSDIYITAAPITLAPFVAGIGSGTSSMVGVSTTPSFVVLGPPLYITASSYAFIIHIPAAVWTALGTNAAARNAVVNAFVAQYAAGGTTWSIVTY